MQNLVISLFIFLTLFGQIGLTSQIDEEALEQIGGSVLVDNIFHVKSVIENSDLCSLSKKELLESMYVVAATEINLQFAIQFDLLTSDTEYELAKAARDKYLNLNCGEESR